MVGGGARRVGGGGEGGAGPAKEQYEDNVASTPSSAASYGLPARKMILHRLKL